MSANLLLPHFSTSCTRFDLGLLSVEIVKLQDFRTVISARVVEWFLLRSLFVNCNITHCVTCSDNSGGHYWSVVSGLRHHCLCWSHVALQVLLSGDNLII